MRRQWKKHDAHYTKRIERKWWMVSISCVTKLTKLMRQVHLRVNTWILMTCLMGMRIVKKVDAMALMHIVLTLAVVAEAAAVAV